jgi:SAM-dependent methyltransferase
MLDVMGLHASSRGRLLDVGCGNGAFLAKMRDLGWEVVGVEPDPKAARVAREDFGVAVFQGRLEEAGLSDGSLDTITMHHVIEHISDPVDVLRECYRIVKPSGILVIVTPNLNALGRHLMGISWRGWEVPRHFTLFTPGALRACVEEAGFHVRTLRTVIRSARWIWAASRLMGKFNKIPERGWFPEVASEVGRFRFSAFGVYGESLRFG